MATAPTLSAAELADELGRSTAWLYDHWEALVKTQRLPRPIHQGTPLMWSRAQVYAWLDRDLPASQRAAAAAWRAAFDAARSAAGTDRADVVADQRAALERRYVKQEA
jgi:predicted DNA-binding transcriptional regulator AlpA